MNRVGHAHVHADGDKYDDKRHGKRTVRRVGDQDGNVAEEYEGDWCEGRMHGFGRYVYADGQWHRTARYQGSQPPVCFLVVY